MVAMTPEVIDRIEGYRPNQVDGEVWARIRAAVVRLVKRGEPSTPRRATALCSFVTSYVAWADGKGIDLDDKNLLEERVCNWFLKKTSFNTEATKDTYASGLARVRKGATARVPAKSQRHDMAPPYEPDEQQALLALPAVQPSEIRAIRLESLLRLGFGAGAAPVDQRFVEPGHVSKKNGWTRVELGVGPSGHERAVTVLKSHGQRLLELADQARQIDIPYLANGNADPHNENSLSDLVKKINGSDQAPHLRPTRLRTTWLVSHLRARTPLDVLLKAAGEGTVARLAELLVYVDDLPEEVEAEILARAEEAAAGGSEETER